MYLPRIRREFSPREQRLQRWARVLKLTFRRSRGPLYSRGNAGGYRILSLITGEPVAGQGFNLTLDEIEAYLQVHDSENHDRRELSDSV